MKVYKNEKSKRQIHATYDKLLASWGVETTEREIETFYGMTHIIEWGEESKPPLVLFHGVGDDSALMWVYNAKALAGYFRIYAVDTMGGPGKSRPNTNYNKSFNEIKWLDELFDKLKLDKFHIGGVSNGSYMAQHYGIMRPDKVLKIVCMAGGIAEDRGHNKSPIFRMLQVFLPEALFPTEKNTRKLIRKMMGSNYMVFTENPLLMEHFRWLLKGFNNMAMSYHKLEFFSEAQISRIREKALFLRGECDPLGDAKEGKEQFDRLQMAYQFFPGVGHGINHEIAHEINRMIIDTCLGEKVPV